MITQEEQWGLNILTNAVARDMAELRKGVAAKEAYVKVLEVKYDAVSNPATGEFIPKPKEEKKSEASKA